MAQQLLGNYGVDQNVMALTESPADKGKPKAVLPLGPAKHARSFGVSLAPGGVVVPVSTGTGSNPIAAAAAADTATPVAAMVPTGALAAALPATAAKATLQTPLPIPDRTYVRPLTPEQLSPAPAGPNTTKDFTGANVDLNKFLSMSDAKGLNFGPAVQQGSAVGVNPVTGTVDNPLVSKLLGEIERNAVDRDSALYTLKDNKYASADAKNNASLALRRLAENQSALGALATTITGTANADAHRFAASTAAAGDIAKTTIMDSGATGRSNAENMSKERIAQMQGDAVLQGKLAEAQSKVMSGESAKALAEADMIRTRTGLARYAKDMPSALVALGMPVPQNVTTNPETGKSYGVILGRPIDLTEPPLSPQDQEESEAVEKTKKAKKDK